MKRVGLIFIMLITIVLITGCDNKLDNNNSNNEEVKDVGRRYNKIALYDNNTEVFNSVIPLGWSASNTSRWDIVNSSIPGIETVTILNEDNSVKLTIISMHSYVDNNKYKEGINYDYYTTYLHRMSASEYISYYMQNNYSGATFLEDKEVDEDIYNQLNEYNKIREELGKIDAKNLHAQNYGVSINIRNDGVSVAKEIYTLGDKYIEVSTGVACISTILNSSLSSLLNSSATNWEMPYLIIYEANNKETFDKYLDDYNFIVANSNFTTKFYAMVEYVSSAIVNAYTSVYAARSKAALDATNSYINSNYSSTSSSSINDKVMEMWDDVIKEVDSYKLEDGSTLKTSIYNESVAQNGNEIYIGSKAGIPIGFNEVAKSY